MDRIDVIEQKANEFLDTCENLDEAYWEDIDTGWHWGTGEVVSTTEKDLLDALEDCLMVHKPQATSSPDPQTEALRRKAASIVSLLSASPADQGMGAGATAGTLYELLERLMTISPKYAERLTPLHDRIVEIFDGIEEDASELEKEEEEEA